MDNSGGKRMGNRVEAGGAGVPPATIPASENLPKNHLFSTISHPAARLEGAPPEVTRCLSSRSCATSGGAASCRAQPRGECAAERPHRILSLFAFHLSLRPKGATASCRAFADGEREEAGEGNLQECLECRRAAPDGWETGGMSTLKTKKTASRTGTLICDKSIHKQRAYHSSGIQQIHPFAFQGMSKN